MGKEKLPPTLDSLQAIVDDLEYEVDELKNKVEDLESELKDLKDLKDSIPEDPKPDLDEMFARLNDIEARI